jgi:hypothetical protein
VRRERGGASRWIDGQSCLADRSLIREFALAATCAADIFFFSFSNLIINDFYTLHLSQPARREGAKPTDVRSCKFEPGAAGLSW